MSWTDDRVEVLKKLWGEGRTAAEIAKELGGVTRNAVIGKAHRLKLSGRASPIQQSPKKVPSNANAKPVQEKKAPVSPPAPVEAILEADKTRKLFALTDLKPSQCRWPVGDPRDKASFGFCGCTADVGIPYCTEHGQMAYQASSKARVLNADDLEREEKARAEKMALNA